jgi:hypothetical protein
MSARFDVIPMGVAGGAAGAVPVPVVFLEIVTFLEIPAGTIRSIQITSKQPAASAPYRCENCQDTGWFDCYCGRDACICLKPNECPCPKCDGATAFLPRNS